QCGNALEFRALLLHQVFSFLVEMLHLTLALLKLAFASFETLEEGRTKREERRGGATGWMSEGTERTKNRTSSLFIFRSSLFPSSITPSL
ncbi:MAG: hypothetical protein SNJ81_12490, partial [Cyanobacteriota bacterium]